MYVCPPLLPLFLCRWLGGRKTCSRRRHHRCSCSFAQHCCSQAAPQCRPAWGWLHGGLRKELKQQKAAQKKGKVSCSLPLPSSWLREPQCQQGEEWEHTPWAGQKWDLMVQKSLSRMVELKLKGCWYKLSLCCEYLIFCPSVLSLCVCGQESSYDCIFLFVWGLCAGLCHNSDVLLAVFAFEKCK